MSGLVTRGRGVAAAVTAVTAAAAAAAGGTALGHAATSPSHVASLPVAGRTAAALKVTDGTTFLDLSVARLGGTLLRVSTPDDDPVRPVLSGSAPVTLALAHTAADRAAGPGRGPADAVTVVLNSAVTWSLDLAGGTTYTVADLRGGKVGGIAVTAGSDVLDVTLPRPSGTLPFLLAGGVSQFLLSLPGGVPAQVSVGGGASFVALDNQSLTGIAGGTVLASPGWATATARFDVDATAGFSRLTVRRWYPAGS